MINVTRKLPLVGSLRDLDGDDSPRIKFCNLSALSKVKLSKNT